jgi:hypothetical protein
MNEYKPGQFDDVAEWIEMAIDDGTGLDMPREVSDKFMSAMTALRAAPDLLYTLQTVEHNITSLTGAYPEYRHREDWNGTLKIVREAIDKAGGETI